MTVLAWWLFLFGVWPFYDPGHRDLNPLVLADVGVHLLAAAYLVSRYWPQRHSLMDRTIGCLFGGHRSCTVRTCSCRCHADRWELLP